MRHRVPVVPVVAAIALVAAAIGAACSPARGATDERAPRQRQRVLLISLDGFRADYITRAPAVHLRALAARGVRAERMLPSFPSKTFPNHYTIVTGLTPDHHGIIANNMRDAVLGDFRTSDTLAVRDPRWWGGEPIWVTAERQGRRAASFFWPGSEARIHGVLPTWWEAYDGRVPRAERVRQVLEWFALPPDSAPAVVTLYFSDTDDAGHDDGPFSPAADSAIAHVDSAVGALVRGIDRLGLHDVVNVIVVADHGMAPSSGERLILLDDYIDRASIDVVDWSPVAMLVPRDGDAERVYRAFKDKHPRLQAYRKGELPARLRLNESPRLTPVVLVADDGWSITDRKSLAERGPANWDGGQHGYDPELPSMGAIFVAAGPGFAEGKVVPPFRNVHVYALMARLLGLVPAPNDGSLDSVRAMLRAR